MKKLLAVSLCIVLCCSCTKLSTETVPNSTGNVSPVILYNECISGDQDENYSYDILDEGIVKIDKNSHKAETIYLQSGIKWITVFNNKLYFVVDGKIMSIDTYGKNKTLELDTDAVKNLFDDGIHAIVVYNDRFYIWTSGMSIAQFDPKTKKVSAFLDDADNVKFYDEYAYYTDHAARTFSLYRMNILTRKVERLRGTGVLKEKNENSLRIDNFEIINHQLYYSTRLPSRLYEYHEDGEDEEIYNTEDSFIYLSFYGGDLLFVTTANKDNKSNLYRYNRDSKKVNFIKKLTDFDPTHGIQVGYGYGYYTRSDGEVKKIKIT